MNHRSLLIFLAGIVVAIVGVPQVERLAENRDLLKPYDFVQYWSAGRLLLDGRDSYDPDQLLPLQRSMYDGVRKTIMMWNPPWTLPLTLPFAALPWRLAQFLWLGLQFGAVLLSADMLWRIYGGEEKYRWVAWLIALTFAPTLFLLLMGQISGLLLLGVTGFLFYMRRNRPIIAGCFAALTAIKPHLLPLFALLFLLESLHDRRARKALVAGCCCLVVCSLLPLLWNSNIWGEYLGAMRRPPSDNFETMREFEHPTIGYRIRLMILGQPFAAQFIPMAFALAYTFRFWIQCRSSWDWRDYLPAVVLFSALTAGYGAWAFDLVLLLLPLISLAAWLSIWQVRAIVFLATIYLVLNALVLSTIRDAGSQSNPWITPGVFGAFVLVAIPGMSCQFGPESANDPTSRPSGK